MGKHLIPCRDCVPLENGGWGCFMDDLDPVLQQTGTSWATTNELSVPNFAKYQEGPAVPGTVLGSREITLFPTYRTASHCFSSLSFPVAL